MGTAVREQVRYVGLDIHKEVAVSCLVSEAGTGLARQRGGRTGVAVSCLVNEAGTVLSRQRCGCTRDALEAFGRRYLRPTDKVALEATTNTWEVVAILKPLVAAVVVSNPLKTKAIAEAQIKTDKV